MRPRVVAILKIQLAYFIAYDRSLKALINRDCIIISAPTSSLIYSGAVTFIRCVITRRTAFLTALKTASEKQKEKKKKKATAALQFNHTFYVPAFNPANTVPKLLNYTVIPS